jgi:hypothetical protein
MTWLSLTTGRFSIKMPFMPKKRRVPTADQRKRDEYSWVEERARSLIKRIRDELYDEREKRNGVIQLEGAIAEACGGFPFLERRKLTRLIDSKSDAAPVTLSFLEIAALDAFWKEKGGFIAKLRAQTLAESLGRTNHVVTFVPSLPWDKQADPEKFGIVPVADVRAATILRQALLGLNPSIYVQFHEIASENGDAAIRSVDELLRGIPEVRGVTANIVSIGSPRTNRLSRFLLEQFFGSPDRWPFAFYADDLGRHLSVDIKGERKDLPDHGVICVRRIKEPPHRLEVVVAGDRSLSTIGAAMEIANYADDTVPGRISWAVIKTTSGEKPTKVATSNILEGFPVVFQSKATT